MRRLFLIVFLGALLASCSAPAPVPVSPTIPALPTEIPTVTPIPHGGTLHFALAGLPTDVNAWALFDEAGAGYANYALHVDEYPSLYRLSIPGREFEPFIADGLPSSVMREGSKVFASVSLRAGLQWSDGSSLTARDVAFTVNTALAFRLGLDWLSAYNPERIDYAEAVDDSTVRFYFKSPINVGDWQYGALQGPILSQAFWGHRLGAASALLPAADSYTTLDGLRAAAAELQTRIDADNAQLAAAPGAPGNSAITTRINRTQADLNSLNGQADNLQDDIAAALAAARAALHALEDEGEPTFGPFLRAIPSGDVFTRDANPFYPFEKPHFDRVTYRAHESFSQASQEYEDGGADALLAPRGAGQSTSAPVYPTSSARFLVFNTQRQTLADPALRGALSCLIDRNAMLTGQGWAYDGFVLPGPWQNTELRSACAGLSRLERLQTAVTLLKEAGYSWEREPAEGQAGSGLQLPNGDAFPAITLLTTFPEYDIWRSNAALYIESQTQFFGIPLTRRELSLDALRYAVYSTREYDMAILGWTLSEYPGYLCGWFQADGPFAYPHAKLWETCDTFAAVTDLEMARQTLRAVQAILMKDLPFIPLYLDAGYEGRQRVSYPFDSVLNGSAGLYGAPSLAIPLR